MPRSAPRKSSGLRLSGCAVCGARLVRPGVGRVHWYCSNSCRSHAKRARAIGTKRRCLARLYQDDAWAFLAGRPDESVDLVPTDPPYVFARGMTYFRDWFPDFPDEAWPEVLAQCYRVLRDNRLFRSEWGSAVASSSV